jgi:hypothetical protein
MSYGFKILRADGSTLVSSDSYGGILLEVIQVTAGTGIITRSYTDLAGATVYIAGGSYAAATLTGGPLTFNITDASGPNNGVSYGGGYPSISIDSGAVGMSGQFFILAI